MVRRLGRCMRFRRWRFRFHAEIGGGHQHQRSDNSVSKNCKYDGEEPAERVVVRCANRAPIPRRFARDQACENGKIAADARNLDGPVATRAVEIVGMRHHMRRRNLRQAIGTGSNRHAPPPNTAKNIAQPDALENAYRTLLHAQPKKSVRTQHAGEMDRSVPRARVRDLRGEMLSVLRRGGFFPADQVRTQSRGPFRDTRTGRL